MKKAIALAVAMAAATGANAAWVTGSTTDGDAILGNGEALFSIFDTANSYSLDLNHTYQEFLDGTVADQAFNLPNFIFSPSSTGISWNVVAGSTRYTTTNGACILQVGPNCLKYALVRDDSDSGLLATSKLAAPGTYTDPVSLVQGTFFPFGAGLNGAGTGPDYQAASGDPAYAGGGSYQANTALFNLDQYGSMGLWKFGVDQNQVAVAPVLVGTFTLDGTSLVWANAATVPVPAAAWMFGSALLGLAGVARKRRA